MVILGFFGAFKSSIETQTIGKQVSKQNPKKKSKNNIFFKDLYRSLKNPHFDNGHKITKVTIKMNKYTKMTNKIVPRFIKGSKES